MSVVPRADGFRLVCNRDERYTRPIALPPRRLKVGVRVATYPIDPESGGTWVGVNDERLAVAIVNRGSSRPSRPLRSSSRGLIAPRLLSCGSIDGACGLLASLDWDRFQPFRVLLVHEGHAAIVSREGTNVRIAASALTAPVMITSSSLGDELVDQPRRALFDDMVLRSSGPIAGQRAFHRHQWPDRPHISVLMRRDDAATVSRTSIDVSDRGLDVAYEATC